ncbi:MAG: replication-associated recombination protein A [Pseudomonadales bacterium]|nr:replication-associated recombination protein A [Pseudomonadales bacterium]
MSPDKEPYQPLAARMRPRDVDEILGQSHLLAPGRPLREIIDCGKMHSMIFWGPPGVGKTTLARLLSQHVEAHFESISAVLSGVKDIRVAVEKAKQVRLSGGKTVLFVDEVHRFNKSQQDAFLPYVEDGTLIFIGATTENPSFELNNALLSRTRVYVLKSIAPADLVKVIDRALEDSTYGFGDRNITITGEGKQTLAHAADGDARRLLNLLEMAIDLAEYKGPIEGPSEEVVSDTIIQEVLIGIPRRFDKKGEQFYDQISALHKSVRGSSPDGALYWFCRMIDGGCDPLYIARRVVRMASEDIGNADPRGLELALNAWNVQERLGSPEGELAIAQAVVYLACAAKSNAVYSAYNAAMKLVKESSSDEVPLHLRNAPTKMMKDMGFGDDYRYAHSDESGYVAGECYFPPEHRGAVFYEPVNRGLEIKISEKLKYLRELEKQSKWNRHD